jgi:ABC-type glycerol-3-phosphate transport system substrate-binding protein
MRFLGTSSKIALYCLFVFLNACTPTVFSSIWKDEAYQGHPKKILVSNSFSNPATRRIFEDELVKAFKERGIDAVASYTSMPDAVVSDKVAAALQAKDVGADTVLISSTSGPKMNDVGVRYINIQTNIYDMKSNNLIFSATSRTEIQQVPQYLNQIQSYIRDLLNQLSRLGLI